MSVGHHIDTAIAIALTSFPEVHERWISVMHELAGRFGVANLRMSHDTCIDLLLRQMETESLSEQKPSSIFRFDMQVALSEHWVMSSYEIVRSCCQFARERHINEPKLKLLRDQLSLVRTPLAKHEIDKTKGRKPSIQLRPSRYVEGADNSPKPYDVDGTYIMPKGHSPETGAVVWYPIDIKKRETVAVCRRDLSDAMLNLFD